MINTIGEGYIGDKYYSQIVYIPAKVCDFSKHKFEEIAIEEVGSIELTSDICEGYYRCVRTNEFERDIYGDYCYRSCEKGRGAVLYYFAGFEDATEWM
jgi:hypothetical protein